jgi:transposase
MENQQLVSPVNDNSSAHWSVLVKNFLAKNNVTTLEPPHPPDLASADYYLFPRMKSPLKGRRFYAVPDIIKNATGELKRLPQNGLQGYFHHL